MIGDEIKISPKFRQINGYCWYNEKHVERETNLERIWNNMIEINVAKMVHVFQL